MRDLIASTVNAAASIGRVTTHGSLEVGKVADLLIRPTKIIVWLSSTTFLEYVWVGGFFFKSKSKLHGIITYLSPNEGADKSILPKNICKQVLNQF